jgi:hypothetical protein
MSASLPPTAPLAFRPEYEQPEPDEAETFAEMRAAMRHIVEVTSKDYGHAVRAVHAKSHGLLEGTVEVPDGLPPALAQGAFARPGTYPAVLRFSTNPGDILDDSVSTPRGLAVKIIGVEGARLPGGEGQATQDFVMQNAPAFSAPTPKKFLGNLKLLARTTDTPQLLKKGLSAVLRGTETVVEALGGESPAIKSLGGHPNTHILGETFYTMVPVLYGTHFGKVSVAPISPELTALTGRKIAVAGHPNALRDAVTEFFANEGGVWEIRVQLCTDLETMPVEDASVVWPEAGSPYIAVARIAVPPQTSWTERRAQVGDDRLSFSPWHGLAAHRPLGGIMRSRREAYPELSGLRSRINGCPLHEPSGKVGLPE